MFKPQAFGKYLLIDKISNGGMGEVYKARSHGSQGFEKVFAIKRILPKLSKEKSFIAMLADEAKIIVSLAHSNIVEVYEFNQVADTYYLAMEFIQGKDLRSIMERVDAIPYEIACYVMVELSKGLHYLHIAKDPAGKKLGIVHRDISPRNIIVSFDGEVKIIDFGIANARCRAFTIANDIFVGKYAYMSPEQLLGRELSPQSDIFSAGIVLYELIFKQLPPGRLGNRSILVLNNDIKDVDPKLDKRLMSTLPQELKTIIQKATNINPDDRYRSALDFHTDLISFILSNHKQVHSFSVAHFIKKTFTADVLERTEHEHQSEATTLNETLPSFIEQKKVAVLTVNMRLITGDSDIHAKALGMFQDVLRIVQRHDGFVYQLRDTELITVFGLPKNQEDDVHRAIRAALEIRNYVSSLKMKVNVALTMALDFGKVIVNFRDDNIKNCTISEGPEKQVQALMNVASAGDILCGNAILHMARDTYTFTRVERNGEWYPSLTDIAHDSHFLMGPSEKEEAFINRKKELDIITHSLQEVSVDQGKTISIDGEAGIGKTALIREIVREAQESNIQVFVGSFHPYIKTPYSFFKELIAEILNAKSIGDISLSKVAELSGFGLSPMELESIKSMLSVRYKSDDFDALPPEKRKPIILCALKKIVRGFGSQKTIMVSEDLHAADELSLEVFDFILGSEPLPNILTIKTHRREFSYAWKNIDPHEISIHLEPLDVKALGDYLKTITSIPLEENSLAQIYHKSSGNPLFAGELIKSLLENKIIEKQNNKYVLRKDKDTAIIPDTIYTLLASRIDALPKESKEVLRIASVIGNVWSVDMLSHFSNKDSKSLNRIVRELQKKGILQNVSNGFTITHGLMRDVVYKNTPADTRELLHERVADYLCEKYMAEIDEHTQVLAYHYSNSNNREKTFHYLVKAGDESQRVYLLNEADRYYGEAIICFMNNIDLFRDSYLALIELTLKRGITNQILGKLSEALQHLSESLQISKDRQIKDFIPKIYHQTSRVFSIQGDYTKALQYIEEALTLSSIMNNPFDTLELLHEQANIYRTTHNNQKALEILEKGLIQVRHLEDKQLVSKYLNNLGIIYGDIDYKKAISFFKESYALRKKMKDKLAISILFSNVSALWYKHKHLDKAIKYAKHSLQISSEIEDKLGICLNLNNLGEMYLAKDDLDTALSYFQQGLTNSREMPWKEGIIATQIHLCLINVVKNQNIDVTKNILKDSITGAKELQHPELIAKAYLVQSKILALEKKVEESKLIFKNAQDVIKQNNLYNAIQDFEKKIH